MFSQQPKFSTLGYRQSPASAVVRVVHTDGTTKHFYHNLDKHILTNEEKAIGLSNSPSIAVLFEETCSLFNVKGGQYKVQVSCAFTNDRRHELLLPSERHDLSENQPITVITLIQVPT